MTGGASLVVFRRHGLAVTPHIGLGSLAGVGIFAAVTPRV